MSVSREELRKLPLAKRLELVEDLWDSIAGESDQLALTQAQIGSIANLRGRGPRVYK